MWQTLLINLKLHLREKTQLFWLFAFPIILATITTSILIAVLLFRLLKIPTKSA